MMYIHFLVIKGACIKIPAIKDDFLFENITLVHTQDEVNLDMHDPMPLLIKKIHTIFGKTPDWDRTMDLTDQPI